MKYICKECHAEHDDPNSPLCPACQAKQWEEKELCLDYDALWKDARYSDDHQESQR